MNSKVNAAVLRFPIFFIAFRLSLTFVDATLPNADLQIANFCLRTFIEKTGFDDDENYFVNDGEHVGVYCFGDFPERFDDDVQKVDGNYDGTEIKQCLAAKDREDIFDNYREKGSPEQSNPSTDAQKSPNANTPLFLFINGVCKSKEFIDFENLKDKNEKKDVLKCLGQCVGKFFERVENAVNNAKSEEIENFQSDDDTISKLKKVEISKQATTFIETLSKNDLQIGEMTESGTDYLKNYGDVYNNMDQFLTEDSILDESLGFAFLLYKNCAMRGCGMKPPNSIPLYKLIEDGSKDFDTNHPNLFSEQIKGLEPEIGSSKPYSYGKFFQALYVATNEE